MDIFPKKSLDWPTLLRTRPIYIKRDCSVACSNKKQCLSTNDLNQNMFCATKIANKLQRHDDP